MLAITPRKVEAAGIAFNHPLDPGPCPPAANATGRPAAAEPCSIKPPAPGPSGRTPGRPPAALVGLRADQLVCPGDGLGVVESRRLSHLPAHLLVVHAPRPTSWPRPLHGRGNHPGRGRPGRDRAGGSRPDLRRDPRTDQARIGSNAGELVEAQALERAENIYIVRHSPSATAAARTLTFLNSLVDWTPCFQGCWSRFNPSSAPSWRMDIYGHSPDPPMSTKDNMHKPAALAVDHRPAVGELVEAGRRAGQAPCPRRLPCSPACLREYPPPTPNPSARPFPGNWERHPATSMAPDPDPSCSARDLGPGRRPPSPTRPAPSCQARPTERLSCAAELRYPFTIVFRVKLG